MENNTIFMSDKEFIQKYIISVQEREWNDIISNWNHSSKQLKTWLDKYFPTEFGKHSKLADINVDIILPYRHNAFWNNADLWRLEYAIKAKLIILAINGLEDERTRYVIEALRLWLRYDSRYTDLTWDQFKILVDKCYIDIETKYDEQVEIIRDLCERYKHKRKQTMYHFVLEDFSIINEEMTLAEAYEYWTKYTFPGLLDKYKNEQIQQFKSKQLEKHNNTNIPVEKFENFKKDLDLVNIKLPSYRSFAALLKKFNIKYNTRNY